MRANSIPAALLMLVFDVMLMKLLPYNLLAVQFYCHFG